MRLVPYDEQLQEEIEQTVNFALKQDLGGQAWTSNVDITASLIDSSQSSVATIITRESGIFCGQAWLHKAVALSPQPIRITWSTKDGEKILPNQVLCKIEGNTQCLLTIERTILNFLQTLSATATQTHEAAALLAHTNTALLDTRKTIPCMRYGQKYAVLCGGGKNHRLGLFDAYLIKENHILGCGSITKAVEQAKTLNPEKWVEVEVESIKELQEAIQAGADWVMLDNFSTEDIQTAIAINQGKVKLEVSGNVTKESLHQLADLGVDYISSGSLTKHIQALDLSLRLD